MYYPFEEQETVITWENTVKVFVVYTTVPKHIRRLKKKQIGTVIHEVTSPEGICIALTLETKKLPAAGVFNA